MVTTTLLKSINELSIISANWLSLNDSDLQQQHTKIDNSVNARNKHWWKEEKKRKKNLMGERFEVSHFLSFKIIQSSEQSWLCRKI